MDILSDAIVIIAMGSVGALWVFSAAGALMTLWDTFGDRLMGLGRKSDKK